MATLLIGAKAKNIGRVQRAILEEKQLVLFQDHLPQFTNLFKRTSLLDGDPFFPFFCRSG